TGSVSTIDAQRHHQYWYWWWSADDGDSDHRRWSSALPGSSPLKPAILDETTLWLRENIETRRVRGSRLPAPAFRIVRLIQILLIQPYSRRLWCSSRPQICPPMPCWNVPSFLSVPRTLSGYETI